MVITLNKNQTHAVHSQAETTVVVAGPGSGKTRVLVERIAHLIQTGTPPREIVAITFTNAAADEIESRLEKYCEGKIHCGTLHGYCLKLIAKYGPQHGLPGGMIIIDEDTREKLLEESMKEMRFRGSRKDVDKELENIPMLSGNQHRTPAQLVSARYHQTLLANGVLDYDSILAYGQYLIGKLRGVKLASHLLVDEFQDSGDVDAAIYRAFPADYKFYVGDSDQSIYSFRGGNPAHMVDLCQSDHSQVVTLEMNYRSDILICKAANNLIAANTHRWRKNTTPESDRGGEAAAYVVKTKADQINLVAGGILGNETSWTNAILLRTNKEVAEWVEAMKCRGIPVRSKLRHETPKDWQAVRLLVAFLAAPENDLLAFRVLEGMHGAEAALEARKSAINAMTSINQDKLHVQPCTDCRALLEGMAQSQAISEDSLEKVRGIVSEIGEDATPAALALRLSEDESLVAETGEGVYIGTIHSAKGREWDAVYLPGWNQEVFPGAATDAKLEETRRLAFVAITRAARSVDIISTIENANPWGGRGKDGQPSQFITEAQLPVF